MMNKTTTAPRRYATIPQAAEYVQCEHKLIRRLIDRGELAGYRIGTRAIRVDLNELDRLIAGDAS